MANKTIQELDAIELADNDLLPVWDTSDGRTKKSAISDMKQKIVGTVDNAATPESNNLITSGAVAAACSYCASDNTTVTGPALFNGAVVKIMFTSAITGSDTTTPLAINYNGTSYNVKATSNGSLKNFTATPIEKETREQTRGKSEEESETKGGEGTRATTTTYVYCQAYTTLELLFDGTQFVIIGNPVVISNADYTIYTDGSIKYTASYINANKLNCKKIQIPIGASYSFTIDEYYWSFQCYGIASGQDRTGGIVIGEGGSFSWYNVIHSSLLPNVSGVYNSNSRKTTITLTNNTSFVQIFDISYIA